MPSDPTKPKKDSGTKKFIKNMSAIDKVDHAMKFIKAVSNSDKGLKDLIAEQEDNFFYLTLVFPTSDHREEFIEKNSKLLGTEDPDTLYLDGVEVASRLGTPLKLPMPKKIVSLKKAIDVLDSLILE